MCTPNLAAALEGCVTSVAVGKVGGQRWAGGGWPMGLGGLGLLPAGSALPVTYASSAVLDALACGSPVPAAQDGISRLGTVTFERLLDQVGGRLVGWVGGGWLSGLSGCSPSEQA